MKYGISLAQVAYFGGLQDDYEALCPMLAVQELKLLLPFVDNYPQIQA